LVKAIDSVYIKSMCQQWAVLCGVAGYWLLVSHDQVQDIG